MISPLLRVVCLTGVVLSVFLHCRFVNASSSTTPTRGDTVQTLPSSQKRGSIALPMHVQSDVNKADSIARINSELALKLFGTLIQGNDKNVLLSPYCVSMTMAMLYEVTTARTRLQIAQALGCTGECEEGDDSCSRLVSLFDIKGHSEPFKLSISNMVFINHDYPPRRLLVSLMQNCYGAELSHESLISRRLMRSVLDVEAFDTTARINLRNGISLSVRWQYAFDSAATRKMSFYPYLRDSIMVNTMYGVGTYAYGEDSLKQVVCLPLAGKRYEMQVLMPKYEQMLHKFEQSEYESLNATCSFLSARKVALYLPRFRLVSSNDMKDQLMRLGITDVFDSNADFSPITGDRELVLSDVIHGVSIDVDEHGMEPSPGHVSGKRIEPDGIGDSPIHATFRVNRPFVLRIVDSRTGTVLIMGRIMDPANAGLKAGRRR